MICLLRLQVFLQTDKRRCQVFVPIRHYSEVSTFNSTSSNRYMHKDALKYGFFHYNNQIQNRCFSTASLVKKGFSFIKDLFSCCKNDQNTAVNPSVVHGRNSAHASNTLYQYKILSDNSVNCNCCNFNFSPFKIKKSFWKRRKAPEKDRSERQPLMEEKEFPSTRPAPEPHPGGGKKRNRSPDSDSSFHSTYSKFSPIHTSPAHTAILRKQGEASLSTLGILHLLVPKLRISLVIIGVLVKLCSAGDLFMDFFILNDISMIEPIKVDLEALAQAQKVGEALGKMQGFEPVEPAAPEIEEQVSCSNKMALLVSVFLLAAAALAYRKYS